MEIWIWKYGNIEIWKYEKGFQDILMNFKGF